MPSPRLQLVIVCIGASAFVAPTSAFSDDGAPPPGTPSIDQYVETVPSSTGGWSAWTGSAHSKPLRPAVTKHLRRDPGRLAHQLEAVATSSSYGAPQQKLSGPANKDKKRNKNEKAAAKLEESSRIGAAFGAVSDSGDSHIYWLLAAILVVTTMMAWAAVRRTAR
jgi:hypothetical protein